MMTMKPPTYALIALVCMGAGAVAYYWPEVRSRFRRGQHRPGWGYHDGDTMAQLPETGGPDVQQTADQTDRRTA